MLYVVFDHDFLLKTISVLVAHVSVSGGCSFAALLIFDYSNRVLKLV